METTALNLLRTGRLRMMLYADGKLTTMKVTFMVLDFGSCPTVMGRVVVSSGEMESFGSMCCLHWMLGLQQ